MGISVGVVVLEMIPTSLYRIDRYVQCIPMLITSSKPSGWAESATKSEYNILFSFNVKIFDLNLPHKDLATASRRPWNRSISPPADRQGQTPTSNT